MGHQEKNSLNWTIWIASPWCLTMAANALKNHEHVYFLTLMFIFLTVIILLTFRQLIFYFFGQWHLISKEPKCKHREEINYSACILRYNLEKGRISRFQSEWCPSIMKYKDISIILKMWMVLIGGNTVKGFCVSFYYTELRRLGRDTFPSKNTFIKQELKAESNDIIYPPSPERRF